MKAFILLLVAVAGWGCLPDRPVQIDPLFFGRFQAMDVDSGEELEIRGDGVYRLAKTGFGSQHSTPIEGRWKVVGADLQIRAFDGRWTLRPVNDGGELLITEHGRRMRRATK